MQNGAHFYTESELQIIRYQQLMPEPFYPRRNQLKVSRKFNCPRGSAPRPTGGASSRMPHFTPAFKLRRQEDFRRIRSLGAKRIQAAATARRLANVLIFQTGFSSVDIVKNYFTPA